MQYGFDSGSKLTIKKLFENSRAKRANFLSNESPDQGVPYHGPVAQPGSCAKSELANRKHVPAIWAIEHLLTLAVNARSGETFNQVVASPNLVRPTHHRKISSLFAMKFFSKINNAA